MAVCGSNFCPEDADSKDIVLDNNQSSTINQSETGVGGNFQTDRTKIYVMVSIYVECYSQTKLTKNIFIRKIQKPEKREHFQASIYMGCSLAAAALLAAFLDPLSKDNSQVLCESSLKGILHQKIFYRLNLIFWIVMGCGIARFGQRGLKTTET